MSTVRRTFTHQEKLSILSRHFKEGVSISELVLEQLSELKKENNSLKRIVGEQALDIDCLKDLNDFLKKKELEEQLKQQENSSQETQDTEKSE